MSKLRDRVFAVDDIKSEVVYIPEWDEKVLVRGLDGRTRARMMQQYITDDGRLDMERLYPELIICTAYDPDTNEPAFEEGDAAALNAKSGSALELLAQTAIKLSGMAPDAVDEAGKNSSPRKKGGTTSS